MMNKNYSRLAPTLAFAAALVAFCVAMVAIASAEPSFHVLLAQDATAAPTGEGRHHGGHRILYIGIGIVLILAAAGAYFYTQQKKKTS